MTNPGRETRRYQIEYWVVSSLRSHDGRPFDFVLAEATVTLRLPAVGVAEQGFVAAIRLDETSVLLAERAAHDVLTKILDVTALEMKVPATVAHRFRSQPDGMGDTRYCVVYLIETRSRPLFMMPGNATEIQRIVVEGREDVQTALYWLRWSYAAPRLPDAFLFTWMALEQLAGVETIQSRCPTCGQPVMCPTHGPHVYTGTSDISTHAEVEEYLEAFSKNRSDPKIIDVLSHPPDW